MVAERVRGVEGVAARDPRPTAEPLELEDVPAAVVCAHCGRGDCAGTCVSEADNSQVFTIIPWERRGAGVVRRLWGTARLATLSHARFFASLPNGDAAPALRFAVLAELFAVSLHAGLLLGFGALLLPDTTRAVLASSSLQLSLLRGALIVLPGLALLMVLLHVSHGVGLDLAARATGSRLRHGLRFGAYCCGWDLVTSPLGLLVTAVEASPRIALRAAGLAITAPRRAAAAYLSGVHHLEGRALRRAARLGGLAPLLLLLATLASSLVVLNVNGAG